jgi:DNA adenine methylase
MGMSSLIKWPGGKSGEIKYIEKIIPPFNRYIEPFFGGGALFFHLKPPRAAVNDISASLVNYYRLVKKQDRLLYDLLISYNNSFVNLIKVCDSNYSDIYDLFYKFMRDSIDKNELTEKTASLLKNLAEEIFLGFSEELVLDKGEFIDHIIKMAVDKICRLVVNNKRRSFSDKDMKANLITGFVSGYYMYFRKVFNDIELHRIENPSTQYRAANFYFIREYCYGSMFRYNKRGDFNIPYGGMSYNKKDFRLKIEKMFNDDIGRIFKNTEIRCSDFEQFLNDINLTANDFLFLDPPYDTDFSDYEGKDFTKADQERLALYLRSTAAQFILIIKNTGFIHDLYKDYFNIITFDNQYTYNVRSRNERNVEHLIITNVPGL